MSLLNFHVELQWLAPLLERLVIAVERIAGPVPLPQPVPRMATLADYSFIPTEEHSRIEAEKEAFAIKERVVPGSEAAWAKVVEYENAIMASYGEEAGTILVNQLPWKVQTNPTPPSP